ncbi:hypothetical protein C1N53_16460 [Pontibacter sp. SGAir0037]|nr:hypothetical protein C1N53_16460 [Pontibacter sp. SGAir0037]
MESLTLAKPLTIINRISFDKEFNKYPDPFPRWGRETLQTLKDSIKECGAQDSFLIKVANQISHFEFIHENEDGFFYSHEVTYKH